LPRRFAISLAISKISGLKSGKFLIHSFHLSLLPGIPLITPEPTPIFCGCCLAPSCGVPCCPGFSPSVAGAGACSV